MFKLAFLTIFFSLFVLNVAEDLTACPTMIPLPSDGIVKGSYTTEFAEIVEVFGALCTAPFVFDYPLPNGASYNPVGRLSAYWIWDHCPRYNLSCGQRTNGGDNITSSTLFPIFSGMKDISIRIWVMMLSEGFYSLDDKISTYYPQWGVYGKENITFEMLLSNSACLSYISSISADEVSLTSDLSSLEQKCINATPHCQPGGEDNYAYNPITEFWHLHFISKRLLPNNQNFVEWGLQRIANKTNIDINDIHVGVLPNNTAVLNRIANLTEGVNPTPTRRSTYELFSKVVDPTSVQFKALWNPFEFSPFSYGPYFVNTEAGRMIYMPAGVGFVTAKFAAELADEFNPYEGPKKNRLVKSAYISDSIDTVFNGTDLNTLGPRSYAKVGFYKNAERYDFAPSRSGVGHDGAGGTSLIYNDRKNMIAAAIFNAVYSGNSDDYELPYTSKVLNMESKRVTCSLMPSGKCKSN